MSQFTLTAARRGVSSVSVDQKTLTLNGDPVTLTADQVERVKTLAGVEITPVEKAKSSSTTGGSSASTAKD